jgi:YHS domain-containing protein
MEWISHNWLWIPLAVSGLFFVNRMGHGWCGMGHPMGHNHGDGNEKPSFDQGNPRIELDPVSRHGVAIDDTAISAVYHGRAYYFESRANRDAFEHDPDKFLAAAPSAGRAVGSRRRCCRQTPSETWLLRTIK